jgi:hypothetical protein
VTKTHLYGEHLSSPELSNEVFRLGSTRSFNFNNNSMYLFFKNPDPSRRSEAERVGRVGMLVTLTRKHGLSPAALAFP